MNLAPIIDAQAKLQTRGVWPDRLELTAWDAARLNVPPAGRILGLLVCPGRQSRVGGYKHPPKKYEVVGREWEPIQ